LDYLRRPTCHWLCLQDLLHRSGLPSWSINSGSPISRSIDNG